jgi:hypothetical protein
MFYAGWSQPTGTSFVNVGYDLNESAPNRLFGWNLTTGWTVLQLERGAVLFRPVMSGTITGGQQAVTGPGIRVSPNPSSGLVQVEGEYEQVGVYNVAGQRLLCQTKQEGGALLDFQRLPPGLYLLHFSTRSGVQVRKLAIRK